MAGAPALPVQRMRIERTYLIVGGGPPGGVRGGGTWNATTLGATSSRKETEKRAWHGLMQDRYISPLVRSRKEGLRREDEHLHL